MPTGKALSAFHDDIWVTTASQLQIHLTVWETAVEEVWSWPEDVTQNEHGGQMWSFWLKLNVLCNVTCLPANYKFDDIGENSVQH